MSSDAAVSEPTGASCDAIVIWIAGQGCCPNEGPAIIKSIMNNTHWSA